MNSVERATQGKLATYLRDAFDAAADAEEGQPPLRNHDLDRLALLLTKQHGASGDRMTYAGMARDLEALARLLKIAAAKIRKDLALLKTSARKEGRTEPE